MKKILNVLSGKGDAIPPVWLMRQAGRYLPEYRALRAEAGSFLNLVYHPERAAEVTVQPVRRFGMDAAILFSDILVVPQALGLGLTFTEGEGPKLDPVRTLADVQKMDLGAASKTWAPVLETVSRVRTQLDTEGFNDRTLIGFAGSPWTIACYAVAGDAHDHDFVLVKKLAFNNPEFFNALIDAFTNTTIDYLLGQIKAGADVVQLFDSWSGVAGGSLFDRYVIAPTRKIVDGVRAVYPAFPIIGFPRLCGNRISDYVEQTGVTAVGLDAITSMKTARRDLPNVVLQGNLDPIALIAGGVALDDAVDRIMSDMAGAPFIFNLGHGILPATPPEHVAQLVARIRKQT